MRSCCNCCVVNDVECPIKECQHWMDHEEDLNCSLIAVEKYGPMTLREIADRLDISFVRVKQIQDKALTKLRNKDVQLFED